MIDLDTLNSEMGNIEVEMDAEGDEEFDVADTIGKALALVTQANLVFHQYYIFYILMLTLPHRFANLPKHTPSSRNAPPRQV